MCKTVSSRGWGVGVEVGVDVGVGVEVLVGMEVGVGMGVGVDMIELQPDKANPTNMKKPIRNKSLFLVNNSSQYRNQVQQIAICSRWIASSSS